MLLYLQTTGLCPWVPLRQSGFESGREEEPEQKTNTEKSRTGESTVAILHVAVRLTLCVPQDSGTARATLRLRDGDLSAVVWLCVCMRANYVFFFRVRNLTASSVTPFIVCARSRSSRKVLIARILRAETVFFVLLEKKNCRRAFYCIPSTTMLRVYLRWRDYATKEFCHGFSVI